MVCPLIIIRNVKNSYLIIPISVLIHLSIINLTLFIFFKELFSYPYVLAAIDVAWLIVAVALDFYPTGRNEKFMDRLDQLLYQYLIFSLAYFTVLYFAGFHYSPKGQLYILIILFLTLTIYRWFFYILRSVYRMEGGNSVNVVVIGKDRTLEKLQNFFEQPDLGYRYKGFFSNKKYRHDYFLGHHKESFQFILDNKIDEIYCLASQLTNCELQELINFADNNFIKLKIVPDNKDIFTRAMDVDLFGTIPVLNLRKSPLESEYAQVLKRVFDILFSGIVILFVLSWLTPLLYILIKFESRGPLFFKQSRHGFNKEPFYCYKFRSMAVNLDADLLMNTKNDVRVTRIGKFLRKTSLDELPQFFNVFMGDMSVVGPRPHMEVHTTEYGASVDKYFVRHFAKPGVTGLAQIKGYRGEIVQRSDIVNRVRMDIFYLEKWSPLLDLKIIYATVANAMVGEEKAY